MNGRGRAAAATRPRRRRRPRLPAGSNPAGAAHGTPPHKRGGHPVARPRLGPPVQAGPATHRQLQRAVRAPGLLVDLPAKSQHVTRIPAPAAARTPAASLGAPLMLAPTTPLCVAGSPEQIGIAPSEPAHTDALIAAFTARMRAEKPHVLGFPGNLAWDYSTPVYAELLSILANNVGDPTSGDASNIHAKHFERAIIDFLTDLARGERGGTYGYVCSGGSDANLFGLAAARHRLPAAAIYVTAATHPSVAKAAALLRMPLVTLPTAGHSDVMDPIALQTAAGGRAGGAVVVCTVGTTMTGAIDDLHALRAAAAAASPGRVHVHVDAALGGWLAPFAEPPGVAWDFADGADTITMSAHKIPGHPIPTGIALARAELVPDWLPADYTGARDRTLSCSRSGLSVTLLWAALHLLGYEGLRHLVRECVAVAEHAEQALTSAGLPAQRSGITVSFPLPGPVEDFHSVLARWHLPTERRADTVLTHLITVPHVTRAAVVELVSDFTCAAATAGLR
jgi:histidine decarboxylase